MSAIPTRDADVAIVGGGPAGSAAAIRCAMCGLSVALTEGRSFPRQRPGESLHPGVLPLLQRLGVGDAVERAGFLRYPGQTAAWGSEPQFVPFGGDPHDPWLGFQAIRETFDGILLDRATGLGVVVMQPCRALRPLVAGGRVVGVESTSGIIRTRLVIDASGGGHWLGRQLGRGVYRASRPLHVHYGYARGTPRGAGLFPRLDADPAGWTWIARLNDDRYAWARLPFSQQERRPTGPPPRLEGTMSEGATRGADVTCRLLPESAGPGYFLAGDAAAVLDPLSSHGVLKALMSGMQAAHLANLMLRRGLDEWTAIHSYREWTRRSFEHDVLILRDSYGRLPAAWQPPFSEARDDFHPRPSPVTGLSASRDLIAGNQSGP